MFKISLTGDWGYRPQNLTSVAHATSQCLAAMPNKPAGSWMTPRKAGTNYVNEPFSITDITQIAERIEQVSTDVRGGKPSTPGLDVKAYRVAENGTYAVECIVRAGFEGPRGLRNHVLTRLEFPDGDIPENARLIKDFMAAIVRAWAPRNLSAQPYEFMKAQGWQAGQICIGWDTYLADSVDINWADLSDDISVTAGDGGHYVTLTGTPGAPNLAQAQTVRRALGYE